MIKEKENENLNKNIPIQNIKNNLEHYTNYLNKKFINFNFEKEYKLDCLSSDLIDFEVFVKLRIEKEQDIYDTLIKNVQSSVDKSIPDYKNNLNLKNFSDLELSDDNYNNNDINNKIIEEKEEYENEESSYNKLKELKYNSANLSQEKLRSIEINTKGKNSVKSENIKDKGEILLNNYNKNNSYNKQIIGKSVTSYEIESDNPNIESNNFNINKKKNQGDN